MTLQAWQLSVLIPARNEEALLPRCLETVLASLRALPQGVSCEVIVVADQSTDATFALAAKMLAGFGTVVAASAGCVGTARHLAATTALHRYAGPLDRLWLANTDADCSVPEDWLLNHLVFADAGFQAIAGIVDVDSFAEHQAHVPFRFRETYVIDADGSHPHIHGANMGIRADAYVAAKGWGHQETAEDHDLWQRLERTSARTISSSSLSVWTSGRKVGRAPNGFAEALAAHDVVLT